MCSCQLWKGSSCNQCLSVIWQRELYTPWKSCWCYLIWLKLFYCGLTQLRSKTSVLGVTDTFRQLIWNTLLPANQYDLLDWLERLLTSKWYVQLGCMLCFSHNVFHLVMRWPTQGFLALYAKWDSGTLSIQYSFFHRFITEWYMETTVWATLTMS